jgi:hypothetical protein
VPIGKRLLVKRANLVAVEIAILRYRLYEIDLPSISVPDTESSA